MPPRDPRMNRLRLHPCQRSSLLSVNQAVSTGNKLHLFPPGDTKTPRPQNVSRVRGRLLLKPKQSLRVDYAAPQRQPVKPR